MIKLRSSIAMSAELLVVFALLYYGFSIYVDVHLYNVTEIPIFLDYQVNYFPSIVYFYSWIVPSGCVILFLGLFPRRHSRKVSPRENYGQNKALSVLIIGYFVYFFIVFVIMPQAINRAGVFLQINENYPLLSFALPITVWCACFVILDSKTATSRFFGVLLILLISLTLVDRSYLVMGLLAILIRVGSINLVKLSIGALVFFVLFTFWKIILFWLIFDVDFMKSLGNIQFGIARFEAITSQSIFINCLEFNHCPPIAVGDFLSSSIGRIIPSMFYDSGLDTTQVSYISSFFPEIAAKGGGLGYSLVAEFSLVFGTLLGPWVLTAYVISMLLVLRLSNSVFVRFIFATYFLRFLRVDFGTGIKGIIVFGFVSLFIYWLLTSTSFLRYRQYVKTKLEY